jgi:hypothetical protein
VAADLAALKKAPPEAGPEAEARAWLSGRVRL